MKLKGWHISLIGLIYFLLYTAYMLSIGPAGEDLRSQGEFAGFGGLIFIFVFVVPGFFISLITFAVLKNSRNKKNAPITSLVFGFIGIIGGLMFLADNPISILWAGLFVYLSWLIAGIIGIFEATKEKSIL